MMNTRNSSRIKIVKKFTLPDYNIKGEVDDNIFQYCLDVYETNQDIFEEMNAINKDKNREFLRRMEEWFVNIQEPKPLDNSDLDDWSERESKRINDRISTYCRPELREYLL